MNTGPPGVETKSTIIQGRSETFFLHHTPKLYFGPLRGGGGRVPPHKSYTKGGAEGELESGLFGLSGGARAVIFHVPKKNTDTKMLNC